jgi:hypothetical protein
MGSDSGQTLMALPWLRQGSGCARGRLGAVSFVQRFGAALNEHVHFHCCMIDGVFAEREDG